MSWNWRVETPEMEKVYTLNRVFSLQGEKESDSLCNLYIMFNIFLYAYLPLYIFFSEVFVQAFCTLLKWVVCFSIVEL